MVKKADTGEKVVSVIKVQPEYMTVRILGTSPIIVHRMAQKARMELLFPQEKKNRTERAQTLKHDPVAEFRASMYMTLREKDPVARLHLPTPTFSRALADVAVDLPGATRAQISRLTSVVGGRPKPDGVMDLNISLFGVPYLKMDVVRTGGMTRTPDIRTRACLPEWACEITVRYVRSLVKEQTIMNLLSAAGQICGIGDWRPQKGGSFGNFDIVEAGTKKKWERIVETQGRAAQDAAISNPIAYDDDTRDLLEWFGKEVTAREMEHLLQRAPFVEETADGAYVAARKKASNGHGKHARA